MGQEALAELRREIHRLQLRHAELLRSQERLVQEMERAVEKRGTISVKVHTAYGPWEALFPQEMAQHLAVKEWIHPYFVRHVPQGSYNYQLNNELSTD